VFYSRIFLIHQYNYFETNKNKTTKDKWKKKIFLYQST
jgi:hypothetical protein